MDLNLNLKTRTKFGKKARQLIEDNQVLGNIYGRGQESVAVQGEYNDVNRVVHDAGYNIPINLDIEGEGKHMALVHEVELDNISQRLHHVTFQVIKKGEKVHTEVPIHLVGDAPATKNGMMVVTIMDSVEIEAVPAKIPESYEISIESLVDENSVIHVSDIPVEEGVEILADGDLLIAKTEIPRVEEEEEPEEAEDVDPGEVPSEHGGDEGDDEESSEDSAKKDSAEEQK